MKPLFPIVPSNPSGSKDSKKTDLNGLVEQASIFPLGPSKEMYDRIRDALALCPGVEAVKVGRFCFIEAFGMQSAQEGTPAQYHEVTYAIEYEAPKHMAFACEVPDLGELSRAERKRFDNDLQLRSQRNNHAKLIIEHKDLVRAIRQENEQRLWRYASRIPLFRGGLDYADRYFGTKVELIALPGNAQWLYTSASDKQLLKMGALLGADALIGYNTLPNGAYICTPVRLPEGYRKSGAPAPQETITSSGGDAR